MRVLVVVLCTACSGTIDAPIETDAATAIDSAIVEQDSDPVDSGVVSDVPGDPCDGKLDGTYCDGMNLRSCQASVTDNLEPCKNGCTPRGGGLDVCAAGADDPCFNDPDGDYCGNIIGGVAGKVYHCKEKRAIAVDDCPDAKCLNEPAPIPDVCDGELLCTSVQWWTATPGSAKSAGAGWSDVDVPMAADTQVVLRHASRLDKTGVYAWGYSPEFTDLTTGKKFRLLHLRPSTQNATQLTRIYPRGFVVGISGGDTTDTGFSKYSSGAHLGVQTTDAYRTVFPAAMDACK